jgi:CubicO group peptidase (beta-lactamase class C family)
MDSATLVRLVEFGRGAALDSVLVTRHGHLVLDAYFAPFQRGKRHVFNSATKGVVGTLIAIGVQQGWIKSFDQPVREFFPEMSGPEDPRRRAMTLQHLLDMTSGLQWDEPLTSNTFVSYAEMWRSPNWVEFILSRPLVAAPGETFNYNSGNSHLLSAIVTRKTGRSAEAFARVELFERMAIVDYLWPADPQGVSTGGAGLELQPLDAAKIGYLYLRNGSWNGTQLLPSGWIERIRRASIAMMPGTPLRYSNQFWVLPPANAYMAVGLNSQAIIVLPELDIVAVTTGRGPPRFPELIRLIREAAKSESSLPDSHEARAALDQAIAAAAK